MPLNFTQPLPPTDDKRWRIVSTTMRRHGQSQNALIETLHTVQQTFGYLDESALRFVAESLRVPLSQVYGVATFYHFFSLKPQGEHSIVLCTGTACYIKGVQSLLDVLQNSLHVKPGETTPDGKLSVVAARCVGSCSLAPVVLFDGELVGSITTDMIKDRLRRWGIDAA